jgi:hypothetical protein
MIPVNSIILPPSGSDARAKMRFLLFFTVFFDKIKIWSQSRYFGHRLHNAVNLQSVFFYTGFLQS